MAKFTSFILLHDSDGEPMLFNIMDIALVMDHAVYLREMDNGFYVMETLAEVNNLIAKELKDD